MDSIPELAKTLITTLGVVNKKISELETDIKAKCTLLAKKDKYIEHLHQQLDEMRRSPNTAQSVKSGSTFDPEQSDAESVRSVISQFAPDIPPADVLCPPFEVENIKKSFQTMTTFISVLQDVVAEVRDVMQTQHAFQVEDMEERMKKHTNELMNKTVHDAVTKFSEHDVAINYFSNQTNDTNAKLQLVVMLVAALSKEIEEIRATQSEEKKMSEDANESFLSQLTRGLDSRWNDHVTKEELESLRKDTAEMEQSIITQFDDRFKSLCEALQQKFAQADVKAVQEAADLKLLFDAQEAEAAAKAEDDAKAQAAQDAAEEEVIRTKAKEVANRRADEAIAEKKEAEATAKALQEAGAKKEAERKAQMEADLKAKQEEELKAKETETKALQEAADLKAKQEEAVADAEAAEAAAKAQKEAEAELDEDDIFHESVETQVLCPIEERLKSKQAALVYMRAHCQ